MQVEIDVLWRQIHQRQKDMGWCAAATMYLAIKYAYFLNGMDETIFQLPSEKEIYEQTATPWFGVTNGITAAYLSRFFSDIGYKTGATLDDLYNHLKQRHIIIVDWMDDDPPGPAEGHCCIIAGYSKDTNELTLVDTSLSGRDIWTCDATAFDKRWFDFEGMENQANLKVDHWMLWANPASLHSDILGDC